MPKVLLIENQIFQYRKLVDLPELTDEYEILPNAVDYPLFIDNVRVWVNKKYPPKYRTDALKYINDFIAGNHIELILMDHILGGAYTCLNGIDLADNLNQLRREESNTILPILFISKTEHNDKNRLAQFEDYSAKYPESSDWITKGFFGDDLLEPEFVKNQVITRIKLLLGDPLIILREQLKNEAVELLESRLPVPISSDFPVDYDSRTLIQTLINQLKNGIVAPSKKLIEDVKSLETGSAYLEILQPHIVTE